MLSWGMHMQNNITPATRYVIALLEMLDKTCCLFFQVLVTK
jgi:hypothetical protein